MNTDSIKTVVAAVLATCLSIVAMATPVAAATDPASAAPPVATKVNADGDLVVVALRDDIYIQINSIGPGAYAIWSGESYTPEHIVNVTDVTRHVIVSGRDHVGVDVIVGELSATTIPEDFRAVLPRPVSTDTLDVLLHGVTVGDDVIAKGHVYVELEETDVADDVQVTVQHGTSGYLFLVDGTTVGDMVNARAAGAAAIQLDFADATAARVRMTGGDGRDAFSIRDGHLGHAPQIVLGEGDDSAYLNSGSWTGNLLYRGQAGADQLISRDSSAHGTITAHFNAGNDELLVEVPLPNNGAGSKFYAGAGQDTLAGSANASGATSIGFELVS